jgi:hypothetical protein
VHGLGAEFARAMEEAECAAQPTLSLQAMPCRHTHWVAVPTGLIDGITNGGGGTGGLCDGRRSTPQQGVAWGGGKARRGPRAVAFAWAWSVFGQLRVLSVECAWWGAPPTAGWRPSGCGRWIDRPRRRSDAQSRCCRRTWGGR